MAQPAFLKDGLVAYYPFNGNANGIGSADLDFSTSNLQFIDGNSGTPKDAVLFNGTTALSTESSAGEWQAGDRLPAESQLCEEFATSRITIRRALQILHHELLIQRQQGCGTFVGPTPARKIAILNADFFGGVARHAPKLQRKLQSWGWAAAEAQVAGVLGLAVGERVLTAQRLDLLSGKPVAKDEVFLVGRFADKLTASDLVELDFLKRWEGAQRIKLDYCAQEVEAVPARPPGSKMLGVKPGSPLLKETNVVFEHGGCAAGLFVSYYRHEHFRLTATVKMAGSNARKKS